MYELNHCKRAYQMTQLYWKCLLPHSKCYKNLLSFTCCTKYPVSLESQRFFWLRLESHQVAKTYHSISSSVTKVCNLET